MACADGLHVGSQALPLGGEPPPHPHTMKLTSPGFRCMFLDWLLGTSLRQSHQSHTGSLRAVIVDQSCDLSKKTPGADPRKVQMMSLKGP